MRRREFIRRGAAGLLLPLAPAIVRAQPGSPYLSYGWRKPAGGDPYWTSVTALLFNDNAANGTTTFSDQSTSSASVDAALTPSGSIAYSNASAPAGMTTSVSFNGSTQYISISAIASFGIGTGAFTCEWFCNPTAAANGDEFLVFGGNGASALIYYPSNVQLQYKENSGATNLYSGASNSIAVPGWAHFAMQRDASGNVSCYYGGSLYISGTDSSPDWGTTDSVQIGHHNNYLTGYMCSLRFTKGVARYSGSTITVPSLPLPTS